MKKLLVIIMLFVASMVQAEAVPDLRVSNKGNIDMFWLTSEMTQPVILKWLNDCVKMDKESFLRDNTFTVRISRWLVAHHITSDRITGGYMCPRNEAIAVVQD